MRTIRAFAILFLLIAVIMAFMTVGAAEEAAMNGRELSWKLFYGPLYPLGFSFALILLHYYLTSPSGQRWRKFRNERRCARKNISAPFAERPGYDS
jgi:hypothetical protein